MGDGEGQPLFNACTGEVISHASSKGIDFAAAVRYAREKGNPNLRSMTFHERGRMLSALALYLTEKKEKFYNGKITYKQGLLWRSTC